ncbi:MAG: cobalamin B12-binding domain-containing protein [Deltaproteobacteria bacterium]|nr:cobalamin B12-binding domain-containing protein [Deltaproteobacteria bacterium]
MSIICRSSPAPRRGEVLLVNPRYARNPCSSVMRHALAPALGLPLIAAATPAQWRVRFHDENLGGDAPSSPVPEVVGITVHTAFVARAYALADRYRAAGARVVLGGLHVTALPEEARRHADVVVVGDGVGPWPQILEGLRRSAFTPGTVVEGSFVHPHYADAPWPRRDILPPGAFLTRAAVVATRGCTQRCGFCYLATRGRRCPYQQRRVADVLAEIDACGEPFVVFTDNNLMADPDYGRELCRALAPRGLLCARSSVVPGLSGKLVRESK